MAIPEKEVYIGVDNLFKLNILLLQQTKLELYSSHYLTSYYFSIDFVFINKLITQLTLEGFIESADFGFSFINYHYRLTFVSAACTVAFIDYHNLYYLYNPIPDPFTGFLINSEFFEVNFRPVYDVFSADFDSDILYNGIAINNPFSQDFDLNISLTTLLK